MYKLDADSPVDLESQFILRMPVEPARVLREAIRNNSTLKDRLTVKIENDMRHGEVRVDNWLLPAKVVDLPTVVESLKTIDGKGFYKTADICQMFICRDEDDQTDEDSPQKSKKKDPNKVEKKYLWPHGITPPSKNVRRRRFRKTLKKKYVEAPEIEKEVKRLLRSDNDAVNVKWEVLDEDDENKVNKGTVIKKEPNEIRNPNVAEHDIFGGAVSDSEEEDAHLNVELELDENSQNSAEDSHLTDSNSVMVIGDQIRKIHLKRVKSLSSDLYVNNSAESKMLTEFTSDMFRAIQPSPTLLQDMDYYQQSSSMSYIDKGSMKGDLETRLEELQAELTELKTKRQQQEMELETIENIALRQRLKNIIDLLVQEQMDKEAQLYELQEIMK